MSLSKKNVQGFAMIGLDFDTNYGQNIHAACQFEFLGYELSVSTGACKPSSNMYPVSLSPILVTHINSGEATSINGSVEDAINFILRQTALQSSTAMPVIEVLEVPDEETIKMKRFGGNEGSAESLYNNASYDGEFKVETKSGETRNVTLGWEQGRGNNYRFYLDGGDTKYLMPHEIARVQVL